MLVDSEVGVIFDVCDLQKKHLTRCHFSSSKIFLVQFHEKGFSV